MNKYYHHTIKLGNIKQKCIFIIRNKRKQLLLKAINANSAVAKNSHANY